MPGTETLIKPVRTNIANTNFTYAEVENLGLVSTITFNNLFNVNLWDVSVGKLKDIYIDIIKDREKYKPMVDFIVPRLEKFIELGVPMRIYIGQPQRFISRGDEKLEKTLGNILDMLKNYNKDIEVRPEQISALIYYLNLMA